LKIWKLMRDERRRGSAWPGEPFAIVQVVIENQVQGHVKQAIQPVSHDLAPIYRAG